jgi:hypothetical protein
MFLESARKYEARMKPVVAERSRDIWAFVVMTAVIVFCFRDVVLGTHSWAFNGSTDRYFTAAFFSALSRQSATWRLTEGTLAGFPMYNNGNFSPYYPFYFLWTSFYGNQLTSLKLMDLLELFHFLLAGSLTFIGLRLFNVHRVAALMGGLAFVLSPYALKMATWLHFTAAYAWMPLTLMAILAVSSGDRRRIAMVATILPGFMAVLAYPAQAAVHLLVAGPLVALVGLFVAWRDSNLFPALARIAASALLLAILCAPLLIPLVFPDQVFVRWLAADRMQLGGGGVPADFLFQGSIAPGDVAALLVPTTHQAFIGDVYIGIPLLVLCVAAFRFSPRKELKIGIASLIIMWIIVLFGDHTNADSLIQNLPFLNQVRNPPRHMPVLLTLVILLAGFGLDDLVRAARGERLSQLASHTSLLLVALAACVGLALLKSGVPYALAGPSGAAFAGASLLCIWAVVRPKLLVIYAAVALMVAARVSSSLYIYPLQNNRITVAPLASFLEDLGRSSAVREASDGRLLFFGDEFRGDIGMPMLALGTGASTLLSSTGPAPHQHFWRVSNFGIGVTKKDLVLGARFLVSSGAVPPEGWKFIEKVGDWDLYENKSAYPMAYGVYKIDGRLDPEDHGVGTLHIALKNSEGVGIAVDTNAPEPVIQALSHGPEGNPEVSKPEWSGANATIQVSARAPALVALNFYAGPAWRVSVNGRKADIVRVNGVHPAVLVGAGHSVVVFRYGSRLIDFLWLASVCTLGVLFGCLIWASTRGMRRPNVIKAPFEDGVQHHA